MQRIVDYPSAYGGENQIGVAGAERAGGGGGGQALPAAERGAERGDRTAAGGFLGGGAGEGGGCLSILVARLDNCAEE